MKGAVAKGARMDLEGTMQSIEAASDESLYILWTNADPVTAEKMVFMYAKNCMKFKTWEKVTIIVWGATTKLVAEDEAIQAQVRYLQDLGVHFTACVTCAVELGVEEKIGELGIDLVKWLYPLTALIKGKKNLITV